MIRLELTEREARALSNSVGLLREAFHQHDIGSDDPPDTLARAHLKLTAALERQEAEAP